MSVIIRLQNLAWSANAMDIRNFFRGLSIPEGGVHIVGGEQGDAFIAFSTDEDARQAMLNNGGRIKEIQVKLLLSSRSEMLKVIETARQAVNFMQMASQPALPAQPVVTQPSPIPSSITGILAQNLKQLQQVPGIPINNVITNVTKPFDQQQQIQQPDPKDISKGKDSKFDRRRSRSSSRERHKKDRGRDGKKEKRDRSRSRDRSRDRDRRRRDRSRSRDRRDRKRDRKDRSRDRDRSKDRIDRYKDDKKNEPSKDTKFPSQVPVGPFPAKSITITPNLGTTMDPAPIIDPRKRFGTWAGQSNTMTNQSVVTPNMIPPYMNANPRMGWNPDVQQMMPPNPSMGMQMPNPNMMGMNVNNSPNVVNSPSNMDTEHNRLSELVERRNPNAFQVPDNMSSKNMNDFHNSRSRSNGDGHFGRGHPRFRPYNRHDGQYRNNRFKVSKDACLKVSNMSDRTLYKDIRRFFIGLFIPNSGLKLINDQYGKYTGVAYVRFSSAEDKYEALKRSGGLLNGQNVVIEHLNDADYDNALDLFVPNRGGRSRDVDDDREEEDVDSSQDLIIVENDDDSKDKTFKVLYLEDLPPFAKEQDIMKMFSDYSLLSILLLTSKDIRKQYVAYVQFVHASDAEAALNDKSKHLIGHISVKVSPCSDSAYEQAKQENTEQDATEDDNNADMDDRQNQMEPSPPPAVPTTRDPRQRRFDNKPLESTQFNSASQYQTPLIAQPPMQPGMFPWRPSNPLIANVPAPMGMMGDRERMPFGGPGHYGGPPQRPSRFHPEPVLDCIFMKGLPLNATDKDVLNLFSDVNVTPTRIHLMLTLQGEPSGDCFCEFAEADEAAAGVTKNGSTVGVNRVTLELVPKSVVNDALGIPNNTNNYGNDMGGMGRGGFRGRGGPMRGRGRGRGGRDFHGRGGRGGYGGPPPMHSEPIEGFGSPGTVVSMENVPYRASIEEIVDFFQGFKVSQNDIIRRFNENGQPTGDARVNLHTTFDAQKAVNTLNMIKLRDRTVTLSILHTS